MSTFSNDTGEDIFRDGLEAVREKGSGKRHGTPFTVMLRSSVVSDEGASGTGNTGGLGGVESTEVISASDCLVFRPG